MKRDLIDKIINLRNVVAYLGEKKTWWNSQFYESSSKAFLSYVFPKSKNTEFSCSSRSARNFVDNQVGATYYHLFRLPLSVEELIDKNQKTALVKTIDSEETAINLLFEISNGLATDENKGPINIGSTDQLNEEMLQVFASEYLNAFKNNFQVHPYLN